MKIMQEPNYRRSSLEKLVGALLLDKVFRGAFLSNPSNRPTTVALYSQSYWRRFGEKLAQLNADEQALIVSISTDSIQKFCEILDMKLECAEKNALAQNSTSSSQTPAVSADRTTAA